MRLKAFKSKLRWKFKMKFSRLTDKFLFKRLKAFTGSTNTARGKSSTCRWLNLKLSSRSLSNTKSQRSKREATKLIISRKQQHLCNSRLSPRL